MNWWIGLEGDSFGLFFVKDKAYKTSNVIDFLYSCGCFYAKECDPDSQFQHYGMRNWRFLIPWTQGRRGACDGFESAAIRYAEWAAASSLIAALTQCEELLQLKIHIARMCMYVCVSKADASYLWQQTDDSAGKQHILLQCWTDLLLKAFRCRE